MLLVGGGGHCRACIDVIGCGGKYIIRGVIDTAGKVGQTVFDYPIIGSDTDLERLADRHTTALVTIGQIKTPAIRQKLFQKLSDLGFNLPVIISPLAYVSPHARIGRGTIVMHHALINAGAVVGENCIVNSKALIEHDAVVGHHCHISTGAILNGGVSVGDGSFVGSGSVIREGVVIPPNALVPFGTLMPERVRSAG